MLIRSNEIQKYSLIIIPKMKNAEWLISFVLCMKHCSQEIIISKPPNEYLNAFFFDFIIY